MIALCSDNKTLRRRFSVMSNSIVLAYCILHVVHTTNTSSSNHFMDDSLLRRLWKNPNRDGIVAISGNGLLECLFDRFAEYGKPSTLFVEICTYYNKDGAD